MASRLFNYFKICYDNGTMTKEQVRTGVTKGYITQEEYELITGEPY